MQRLSHPHHHDVTHLHITPHCQNLIYDLGSGQITGQVEGAGQTEGTLHGTAGLGRDAEGIAIFVRDDDRLHRIAIFKHKQVLAGAVIANFYGFRLKSADRGGLRQLGTQRLGDVSHLIKVADIMLVQPFENLGCAIAFFALPLKKLFQGRQSQVFEVGSEGIGHRLHKKAALSRW